jgi:hypothetical protein
MFGVAEPYRTGANVAVQGQELVDHSRHDPFVYNRFYQSVVRFWRHLEFQSRFQAPVARNRTYPSIY